jgi:hypothetical protein
VPRGSWLAQRFACTALGVSFVRFCLLFLYLKLPSYLTFKAFSSIAMKGNEQRMTGNEHAEASAAAARER